MASIAAAGPPALVVRRPPRNRGVPRSRLLRFPQVWIGAATLAVLVGAALVGPALVAYGPADQDYVAALAGPTGAHWLGTDNLGRDTLSRLLVGGRLSLTVAAGTVIVSVLGGLTLGLVAGSGPGWLDALLMRVVDGILAFPGLVLALTIAFVLGPNLLTVVIALSVVRIPPLARLIRAQAISYRTRDFVTAAQAIGASGPRIALVHLLPNMLNVVLIQSSLAAGQAIFTEASLSFLGMGLPPPAPSWGGMLRDGYQYLEINPWQSFAPGACIFLAVLACNFLGDGLRDMLDPRERHRRAG